MNEASRSTTMRLPLTQVTVARATFEQQVDKSDRTASRMVWRSVMIDRQEWERIGRPVEVEVLVTARAALASPGEES